MSDELRVRGLTVAFRDDRPVLEDVSLDVPQGEVLALVGESGSGKSMTAMSVMRLLPDGARLSAEEIAFGDDDILGADERRMNAIRGGRISMLFQQPKRMLDPTATVGSQVAEPLRKYLGMNRRQAHARAVELLADVGIPEPERRVRAYAHQLSGGIAQRVMIAIALAAQPELLIADEPTTALDVTVEAQILQLIQAKKRQLGMSVLFISHDLGVVSSIADRIAVMYAGRIVEEGTVQQILSAPQHPYTQALIKCSLLEPQQDGRFYVIPGDVTTARTMTTGCRFMPRCPVTHALGIEGHCVGDEPALTGCGGEGHRSRCWATIERLVDA